MVRFSMDEAWDRLLLSDDQRGLLAEGALLIAAHEYPDLDIDAYLERLHAMAETLRRRLRPDITPSETLIALNHYLFDELGLRGNGADYYDPRNSFINEVIDRGLGIPISLAVVYIDIGRRLGLALDGISFPSHFLVKCTLRSGVVIIDPFAKGISLSPADLRRRLGVDDDSSEAPLAGVLRSATTAEILARMLRNLRAIHRHRGDLAKALWAADRIVALQPTSGIEYRERGSLYLELECCRAALDDFRAYARLAPEAAAAERIEATLAELEQRAARLN